MSNLYELECSELIEIGTLEEQEIVSKVLQHYTHLDSKIEQPKIIEIFESNQIRWDLLTSNKGN
jgi:hypothetical protein